MFCNKCGNQIADGMKFCTSCGTPVGQSLEQAVEQAKPVLKTKKRKLWLIPVIIVVALILIAIVAVGSIFAIARNAEKKYRDQIETAEKYLDDLDYTKAIAAYKEAIELRPEDPDGYIGLAQTYAAMAEDSVADGKYDEAYDSYLDAVKTLKDGTKKCEDTDKLEDLIEEYEARIAEIDEFKRGASSGNSENDATGSDTPDSGSTDSGSTDSGSAGSDTSGDATDSDTPASDTPSTDAPIAEDPTDDNGYVDTNDFVELISGCWLNEVTNYYNVNDCYVDYGAFFSGTSGSATIVEVSEYESAYAVTMTEGQETWIDIVYSNDEFQHTMFINGLLYYRPDEDYDAIVEAADLGLHNLERIYYASTCVHDPQNAYVIVAYVEEEYVFDNPTYVEIYSNQLNNADITTYQSNRVNYMCHIITIADDGTYLIDSISEMHNTYIHFDIYYYGDLIASSDDDWSHKYYRGGTGVWYYELTLDNGTVY